MKNWFSLALLKFRWSKMTRGQHVSFVVGIVGMLLSAILLCLSIAIPTEDSYGLNDYVGKYVCILFSFLFFTWGTMFTSYIVGIEGRINQKYLSEMNEIRKSLGRKEWRDI